MLRTFRVLAENGPVHVELAHMERHDAADLVVKHLQGFDTTLERRLTREAGVVTKLEHPNILALLAERDEALANPYTRGSNHATILERAPSPNGTPSTTTRNSRSSSSVVNASSCSTSVVPRISRLPP